MILEKRAKSTGFVRPGKARDEKAVRAIAEEVFTIFGEYGSWLPGYLNHPGVWSFVYEQDGLVVGFAMLGVLEPDDAFDDRMADLLAIAVRQSHQGLGVGTALLKKINEKAHDLKEMMQLAEVRLTVAEPNETARRLFAKFGFVEVKGNHGFYDKGQRALRLKRVL